MSEKLVEVDLGNGVLSFDGRVVEFFGFSDSNTRRLHISLVQSVSLSSGGFTGGQVTVEGHGVAIVAGANPADDRVPEVEQWMQSVRDAAPNLKQ